MKNEEKIDRLEQYYDAIKEITEKIEKNGYLTLERSA